MRLTAKLSRDIDLEIGNTAEGKKGWHCLVFPGMDLPLAWAGTSLSKRETSSVWRRTYTHTDTHINTHSGQHWFPVWHWVAQLRGSDYSLWTNKHSMHSVCPLLATLLSNRHSRRSIDKHSQTAGSDRNNLSWSLALSLLHHLSSAFSS